MDREANICEDLADWFKPCRVTTVAVEAAGVCWIVLFHVLVDRWFEVCLVNARPELSGIPERRRHRR